MKIIYAFLIAFILSVIAFFLAFSLIDNSFAGLFLLEMLPVTFIVILLYTNLLNSFQVKAFKYVVLYTFIACYIMVFMSAFLLGSDSERGVGYAFKDAFHLMKDIYLLICNIAITLIYSTLFVLFSRLSRKKNK
ncbi:hypothetical protein HMPREF1551_00737 [Capnocytophaga sp. oral taxon 863 str. F0517]|uniref:hypothetical protein n=1 Tax=Capnocytophaga sp. oral taxon 863 TaxID=1227265 RepID=UPI0003984CEC|nr:hypothetical protein [Capnocytophaga sp. oral taxon 863]ERI64069.1 hypothetical protein HMPREF1551_00737 [Capnocytophaga sp. oral taxon 863 str. F0517]